MGRKNWSDMTTSDGWSSWWYLCTQGYRIWIWHVDISRVQALHYQRIRTTQIRRIKKTRNGMGYKTNPRKNKLQDPYWCNQWASHRSTHDTIMDIRLWSGYAQSDRIWGDGESMEREKSKNGVKSKRSWEYRATRSHGKSREYQCYAHLTMNDRNG